jgi:hypothetical protein
MTKPSDRMNRLALNFTMPSPRNIVSSQRVPKIGWKHDRRRLVGANIERYLLKNYTL